MHRPRRLPMVLALLFLLGCSGDPENPGGPGPDPDPDPEFDIDIVVFRVYSLESGGRERLRWIGSADGPLPGSPEPTRWPWIGYGRGFRVAWKAYSADAPIEGTRYRVSQLESGPWLPVGPGGAAAWGHVATFQFENFVDPADLPANGCPEGPDCAGDRRFASGRHRLQVRAITAQGREIDAALGELEFEVNYPPSLAVVLDPASGPEDPLATPVVSWTRPDGSTRVIALAAGDTVPSGATLRVRLRGRDRLRSSTGTDSFCCDVRLDDSVPEVSFQGFASFVRESARGERDSLFTMVGESSPDSVFAMELGPFDYAASFRARDEHDRRGEVVSLDFVAGFPPRRPDVAIADGSTILLHPDRDPAPGEGEFQRGPAMTLRWDSALQDWSAFSGETELAGVWYEIPLRFRGAPDARALDVSEVPPPTASVLSNAYSDHVRGFAYELVHEGDPLNLIGNGPGDRPDLFLDADRLGELDLEGERAWLLFIPDLFFESPEFFDPAGACVNDNFCAIGDWLRQRLGRIELRLRSRTTAWGSTFHQVSPAAARDLIIDLSQYGRHSPILERDFAVRLALTDESGQLIGVWPPAAP